MTKKFEPSSPSAFISYSHDSPEHKQRIFDLAKRLRSNGVDAWIDQFEPDPVDGWAKWMEDQLETANFILVVCTAGYLKKLRTKGHAQTGKGVSWETRIIYSYLYERGDQLKRFVTVLPPGSTEEDVPRPLRDRTLYRFQPDSEYNHLYRRVTGQDGTDAGPLGPMVALPMGIGVDGLELRLFVDRDPIKIGDIQVFHIQVRNTGVELMTAIKIDMVLEAMEYQSGEGPSEMLGSGQTITVKTLPFLNGGRMLTWTVRARALQSADSRAHVLVKAENLSRPLREVVSTKIEK
ncbi:hypothetical protein BH09SUM1_BH09SUM1_23320 [soil metagenome]